MWRFQTGVLAVVLMTLSGCAMLPTAKAAEPAPTPTPLLASRGTLLPIRDAIRGVAFRPFYPATHVQSAALLPAYAGPADTRAYRGVGMEYAYRGKLYALSQWPHYGQMPIGGSPAGTVNGCALTRFERATSAGVFWQTPALVMTLQGDGDVAPLDVIAEAKRLVRRGACR